ncbi:acylphosphatase [Lachnospiraceae bacterium]|nr:acylphosphatase [Lachnospiraceae bacterium]
MIVRKHFIFSGSVQGVGFRYRAYYSALKFGLTGFVCNLSDGTVEMELQGDPEAISQCIGDIDAGHFIHIDGIESKEIPLSEESGFKVRGSY